MTQLATSMIEGQADAMKIYDSFSKIKPGAFRRKHIDLGNYDQCIMTRKSRYVLIRIRWPRPEYSQLHEVMRDPANSSHWITAMREQLPLFYFGDSIAALCFPASCHQADIQAVIQSHVISQKVHPYNISMISTEAADDNLFPDHQILRSLSRTILIAVILVVVVATCAPSRISWLQHFDASRNNAKLFQVTTDKRMNIFSGFKVAYLLSSMISHYGLPSGRPVYPFLMETQQFLASSSLFNVYTKVGFSSVSFNFVIGASLAVITWMTEMRRRGSSVRFSTYFMFRVLRALPLVTACHLFGFSMPLFPAGWFPYMQVTQKDIARRCHENWWRDYVFMANSHTFPETVNDNCNPATWFLSADMQLYVLSFFTIMLLYNKPRRGIQMIGFLVAAGIVLQFISIYMNDVSPVIVSFSTSDTTKIFHIFTSIYAQWYNNMSSYAIGLLLGYIIYIDYQVDQKSMSIIRYASAAIFLGTNVFVVLAYEGDSFLPGRIIELIFGSCYKAIVSAAFAGSMFVAFNDETSMLHRLLSQKWMIPLSRISFSIYLIHMYIIAFIWGMTTDAFHFQYVEMLLRLLLLYSSSIILGYGVYLCFEAPFYNLIKSALKSDSLIDSKKE